MGLMVSRSILTMHTSKVAFGSDHIYVQLLNYLPRSILGRQSG